MKPGPPMVSFVRSMELTVTVREAFYLHLINELHSFVEFRNPPMSYKEHN